MPAPLKIKHEKQTIPGPIGSLEALTSLPEEAIDNTFGVLCHPHSLQGGSMQNKVVHTASGALSRLGIPSVRFNFRSVGASSGQYDDGIGETDDCMAVTEWAREKFSATRCILIGFSFGAYVSQRAASTLLPHQLISLAPPVNRWDYKSLPPITCPWLVVHGTEDEIVPYQAVLDWEKKQNPQPKLITLEATSHFFHGKLIVLRELLQKEIAATL